MGEELLAPTSLYTRVVINMLERGAKISYIAPITGHGWKKIYRAKTPDTYVVEKLCM